MRTLLALAAALSLAPLAALADPTTSQTPPTAAQQQTAPPVSSLPATVPGEDPKTTEDVRCVIVAYTLTQSSDPDLQKLGAVSLFYFWGRLEGRGATANMSNRLTQEAARMSADDVKAQANICGGLISAGTESLRALNNTVQDHAGTASPTPK